MYYHYDLGTQDGFLGGCILGGLPLPERRRRVAETCLHLAWFCFGPAGRSERGCVWAGVRL